MPKPKPTPWYVQVAEAMARRQLSLSAACAEQGIVLTTEDALRVQKDPEFAKVLRVEKNKYYRELATDPSRDKRSAVGMMLESINHLMVEGEWDKALEGLIKLSKLEGWLAPDGQVSIFATLSAKDLDEIKKRLADGQDRPSPPRTADSLLN